MKTPHVGFINPQIVAHTHTYSADPQTVVCGKQKINRQMHTYYIINTHMTSITHTSAPSAAGWGVNEVSRVFSPCSCRTLSGRQRTVGRLRWRCRRRADTSATPAHIRERVMWPHVALTLTSQHTNTHTTSSYFSVNTFIPKCSDYLIQLSSILGWSLKREQLIV